MEKYNIYLSGVGGQGIGMISEIILRAVDHAGFPVKSVDTHGLAQRGGIVVSQIRMGQNIFSPLIPEHEADIVISLERHEALRGAQVALKNGGVMIYYNAVWQPLGVRLGNAKEITQDMIQQECEKRDIRVIQVMEPDLMDSRMQNIAVLSDVVKHDLIPGLTYEHYKNAMDDLMAGQKLDANVELFNRRLNA